MQRHGLALSLPSLESRASAGTRPTRVQPWLDECSSAADRRCRHIGDVWRPPIVFRFPNRSDSNSPKNTMRPRCRFGRARATLTGRASAPGDALRSGQGVADPRRGARHRSSTCCRRRPTSTFCLGARLTVALIHRCLQCTARVLINSYRRTRRFRRVPKRCACDLYIRAAAIIASDAVATDSQMRHRSGCTYRLLLALANPYGFLPGQLGQVINYLQEYSHTDQDHRCRAGTSSGDGRDVRSA